MADEEPSVEAAPGAMLDAETQIENAIKAYELESGGDGLLITGWVVVAEWIDENGDATLSAFARERMPYWRIDALLDAGPDALVYEDWDEDID